MPRGLSGVRGEEDLVDIVLRERLPEASAHLLVRVVVARTGERGDRVVPMEEIRERAHEVERLFPVLVEGNEIARRHQRVDPGFRVVGETDGLDQVDRILVMPAWRVIREMRVGNLDEFEAFALLPFRILIHDAREAFERLLAIFLEINVVFHRPCPQVFPVVARGEDEGREA